MSRRIVTTGWSLLRLPIERSTKVHIQLNAPSSMIDALQSFKWISSRSFQTSSTRLGLDEFFEPEETRGEDKVRSGRSWRMDELRLKSNSDLHKLWFVLYKERNMLYTMREAAKEESEIFPNPERIDKVEDSMENLENVVRERNKAYWDLEVSPCATGERPFAYRRDIFGRYKWIAAQQHLVPYSKNRGYRETDGPGRHDETESFFRHYREIKRRQYNYKRSKLARHIRDLMRRFPNVDVDYLEEKYPQFPNGYMRHLKRNLSLYDDPPRPLTEMGVYKAIKHSQHDCDERLLK